MCDLNRFHHGSKVAQALQFLTSGSRMVASSSLVVHGPSGTGKTTSLLGVAQYLGIKVFQVSAPQLFEDHAGDTPSGLAKTLRLASAASVPSIVVFDAAELLFSRVDNDALVSVMVSYLDAANSSTIYGVVLVTSRPSLVHADVLTMMDDELEFDLPTAAERRHFLERVFPHLSSLDEAAVLCHSCSIADLDGLCYSAKSRASRRLDTFASTTDVTVEEVVSAAAAFTPSSIAEVAVTSGGVAWDDIGGLEDVKASLQEAVVWMFERADAYKRLGIQPSSGILLYGPPGSGKTMLAKAAATESRANFINVRGTELISSEIGEGEKAVVRVFRKARAVAPCIVFIDEVQAMFSNRDSAGASRIVSQLLIELDRCRTSDPLHGVVVLAATNVPDAIDSSLMRPGRFEQTVYVPAPDAPAREAILRHHAARASLADDISFTRLVEMTKRCTGAEIANLFRRAALEAIIRSAGGEAPESIQMRDFDAVPVLPSVTYEMESRYESFKRKLASHGH